MSAANRRVAKAERALRRFRISRPAAEAGKEMGTFWFLISQKRKIAASVTAVMCAVNFAEPG
jgi:hypothetical protein